jgi:NAD(P)-dependent dehydrogenase (short-subunit alcohol dehydrogenase family)
VNLTGVFFCVRAALVCMLRAGHGSIITCGSTSSLVAAKGGLAPYRGAKGGVLMLTRTVAVEYAERGIRANCICPGPISTDLSVVGMVSNPMQRYGNPDEIAGFVAMLASDDATFMTGQAVVVDGGLTAE